jgi:RNA polymerase sigma-70 factor, ECF subfamily
VNVDPELIEQVRRAQEGDLDAFCYVVTAHRSAAIGMARSILRDTHAAEDAAQDAFMVALDRLGDLREPAAFAGWLRALVRTAAIRSKRRRREVLVGEAPLEGPALQEEPERALGRLEERALVRAAIRELSPKAQAVIERFYLRGLSIQETAHELGVPAGTVKRRLFEAREHLRPRLAGLTGRPALRTSGSAPRSLRLPL